MTKLTRYNLGEIYRTYSSDKHNVVCIAYDVEKLEAKYAELLEALKAVLPAAEAASESLGRFCSDEGWAQEDMDRSENLDVQLSLLRAAIAKAEGGNHE